MADAKPGEYADPENNKYPIDTAEHCRAAWSYINMPKNQQGYSPEELAQVKSRIKTAAKKFGVDINDGMRFAEKPRAEIETRDIGLDSVNFAERIITVIAAPYDQPAVVPYRGEIWHETFERGAWSSVANSPHRVRANRDHNKSRTVGKAMRLDPSYPDGLLTEIRIAKTALGDETLALADDDCLSASVGFGVLPTGQQLDKSTRTRRITTAYLDHVAFVESPAYEGAEVLGVRSSDAVDPKMLAMALQLLTGERSAEMPTTPNLDQFTDDDVLRWASERLNTQ